PRVFKSSAMLSRGTARRLRECRVMLPAAPVRDVLQGGVELEHEERLVEHWLCLAILGEVGSAPER
ncbi:MAG: hypothetical protein M3O80_03955, partial [Chloroflexota bacterium]|nr:hypothetical protein [Chloroflexota bacterium]